MLSTFFVAVDEGQGDDEPWLPPSIQSLGQGSAWSQLSRCSASCWAGPPVGTSKPVQGLELRCPLGQRVRSKLTESQRGRH
jgi:hypothetical protein